MVKRETDADVTATWPAIDGDEGGFSVQLGVRGGRTLMWVSSDGGQTGGIPVDRSRVAGLVEFLERALEAYPGLEVGS